ncbi:MAG: Hpt domain-containing protein [Oligoflexales bacterium]|nr:Hpt domain-containing protein [Oligoflexales bacterium]
MTDTADALKFEQMELKRTFFQEASEQLEQLELLSLNLEKSPTDEKIIQKIFRLMHTLKGSSRAMEFYKMSGLMHVMESLVEKITEKKLYPSTEIIDVLLESNNLLKEILKNLMSENGDEMDTSVMEKKLLAVMGDTSPAFSAPVSLPLADKDKCCHTFNENLTSDSCLEKRSLDEKKEPPKAGDQKMEDQIIEDYISIPIRKIDDLLKYVGEQIILQSILEEEQSESSPNPQRMKETIKQVRKISSDLLRAVKDLRKIKLKSLFLQMHKAAREASKMTGKPCRFISEGDDYELDKNIIVCLKGVVSHIVYNAVDHGIEHPDIRKARGKPEEGTIRVRASQETSFFFLEIADDGGGLDKDKIRKKAISKKLISEGMDISDEQISRLIFERGFSTKKESGLISGRGIGLDAVKSSIENHHGTVEVKSIEGLGTTITLKLPIQPDVGNRILF